jgi:hypothetical protein
MQGSTGTATALGKAATMVAQEAVEAMVVPAVAALRQAEAARPDRIAVPPVAAAVRGRVEPCPAGAAMVLVAEAAAYLAGVATTPAAVADLETVGAMAAARPGRIVVPRVAGPVVIAVAMVHAAVAAAPGRVVPMAAPVAVVPLPAVPVVRAMAAMSWAAVLALAGAAARPGLVVEALAAVPVGIEPYLVEEVAGAPCARQRPGAQGYLAEKAVAVPYVRCS